MKNTATLLITCPDTKGIVAAIADFLYQHNANILHADQHLDSENNLFLMRVEWDASNFNLDEINFNLTEAAFEQAFEPIANKFKMHWQLKLSQHKTRVAIMVSQYDHCLADLLHRHKSGELACDIPLIISNHRDTEALAKFYGIEGPIIEQGIDRISHRDQVEDLIQKGRDLERVVLSKAVRWHIENRILLYANKTVIFD